MRKTLVATIAAAITTVSVGQTYVPGYIKADGSYVAGHYKSAPNETKLDNYSTKGNSNPFTGKAGTADPYKPSTPTYQMPAPTYQPYGTTKTQPSSPSCLRDIVTGKCF